MIIRFDMWEYLSKNYMRIYKGETIKITPFFLQSGYIKSNILYCEISMKDGFYHFFGQTASSYSRDIRFKNKGWMDFMFKVSTLNKIPSNSFEREQLVLLETIINEEVAQEEKEREYDRIYKPLKEKMRRGNDR